jgi:cystine transport system substrate-binding protein
LVPLALIAVAVLVAPAVGGANPSQSAAALRAQDAAIVAKSRAAVLNLYSLDQQFGTAQSKLAGLQTQATVLRSEQASLRHQLDVARRGTRISQRRLADRLRTLYEEGNVEPLEVVFGARNLDEALTNLDNLNRVAGQGEDVLRELSQARTALHSATRTLNARSASLARATREARATADALAATRAQRSSYIASLATQRRMTEGQITSLLARAQAAQARTTEVTHTRLADSVAPAASISLQSAPVSSAGSRTITVSATGYALSGRTATGLPVGWGVVAVDPSLIPLGSHMSIPGYGEAVAADTGGAIVGATIDLWFPTVAQANAWGRRTVTIVLH